MIAFVQWSSIESRLDWHLCCLHMEAFRIIRKLHAGKWSWVIRNCTVWDFEICFCCVSDQSSQSVKKLSLHVMALPGFPKSSLCNSRSCPRITLEFVNATMPQCGQTDLKELCFPHKDTSNPHITENRFPGALRQLRRLSRFNVCPNYTISYNVETGGTPQNNQE